MFRIKSNATAGTPEKYPIKNEEMTSEELGHVETLITRTPVTPHPVKGCERCQNLLAIRKAA